MNNIQRYAESIKIRLVEETLLNLFKEGKLNGTVHTCVGQEFTGVAISEFLVEGDFVVSNHRGHGHYIARTGDVFGLISELMGKKCGTSGGFGGSQHLINNNYISNGIQGGMVPIATGVSMGFKLKKQNNIAVAYIGDGTLGEGIIYETFNIASLWSCPILIVLENNQYAQSTSQKQSFAGSIKDRISGFGMNFMSADTWNLDELFNVAEDAIKYVRNEKKPLFLEINTYRLNSHSKGDDNRSKSEIEEYENKDLINIFKKTYPEKYSEFETHILTEIDDIVKRAEQSEDLVEFNKSELTYNEYYPLVELTLNSESRINELIFEALENEFLNNQYTTLIGEDIEYQNKYTETPYGGAFKVTKNLSEKFPDRVRNTPISEAAITGISNGLAINGFRAITEIMFGDFCTLILDQLLQHGAKFNKMFNGLINVPHVIRTPMGGKRGYGPTHSQSLEKYFIGIPDLNVISINYKVDPREIYSNIFKNVLNPCLVIENKILYTKKLNANAPLGFKALKTTEDFPTIIIRPNTTTKYDITIFCYGEILEDAEIAILKAFEDEEILCEIVCPTQISPINISSIIQSVSNTNKLLIIEEGANFAALGSEIVSSLIEHNVTIDKLIRIGNNNIIPSSYKAELNILPNVNSIYNSILELNRYER